MVHLLHILQTAFFLSLSAICFFGFGLPCIKRFLANEITVNEFVEKKTSLKAPSVTICPQMWKPDSPPVMPVGHYKNNCGDANDTEAFSNCVSDKTFAIGEVIVSATQGYQSNLVSNLSDPQLWTSDMTMAMVGRCYTLHYDQLLKVDQETEAIIIDLVPANYYVFLHDPDFFLFTINPLTMPTTTVNLNVQEMKKSYLGISLELVRREKLTQCNPSPDYKFTNCVKQSLAKIVNCSLPWNDRIAGALLIELYLYFFPGLEVCSNMDQFEKYERLYFNLSKKDQFFIEDTTGCLYPCSYPEYKVGDKKVFPMGAFGLYISYGSVAVTVKKEVRVKYRLSPGGTKVRDAYIHCVTGLQLHICLAGLRLWRNPRSLHRLLFLCSLGLFQGLRSCCRPYFEMNQNIYNEQRIKIT